MKNAPFDNNLVINVERVKWYTKLWRYLPRIVLSIRFQLLGEDGSSGKEKSGRLALSPISTRETATPAPQSARMSLAISPISARIFSQLHLIIEAERETTLFCKLLREGGSWELVAPCDLEKNPGWSLCCLSFYNLTVREYGNTGAIAASSDSYSVLQRMRRSRKKIGWKPLQSVM